VQSPFPETVLDRGAAVPFHKPKHWPVGMSKLVLFFPEAFTPVCESELKQLNEYLEPFREQNVHVVAACTDPIEDVAEWFKVEETLRDAKFTVFCSYDLAHAFGVADPSLRAMRSSVFVMTSGETIVQQHFFKVGRSLSELHRQAYAYNHDFSDEGWEDPTYHPGAT
jgi:alkyl hydroperoxide reductase subunit AhpC